MQIRRQRKCLTGIYLIRQLINLLKLLLEFLRQLICYYLMSGNVYFYSSVHAFDAVGYEFAVGGG
jgi:hypothetical protein